MKKLLSLILALLMALSLAACGSKADPTPDPGDTIEALLQALLQDETTQLSDLFGYTSRQAILDDWLEGEDTRTLLKEGFVEGIAEAIAEDGIDIDDGTMDNLFEAFLDTLDRVSFSCETSVMDEKAGTAAVTVTVSAFPEDVFGTAFEEFATDKLLAAMDKLTDEDSLYDLVFELMTEYVKQLQPTSETKSFTVTCNLTSGQLNGTYRKFWLPDDAEDLGTLLMANAFGFVA